MIAVDTSALMAILQSETEAESCVRVLAETDRIVISAGTLAEALIVAAQRGLGQEMSELTEGLDMEIVSVSPAAARRVAACYATWGRGVHPAGLNFGDCFAYEVAARLDCPLLNVGDDFSRTDLACLP